MRGRRRFQSYRGDDEFACEGADEEDVEGDHVENEVLEAEEGTS